MYQTFFGLRRTPFDAVADLPFVLDMPSRRGALDALADLVRRRCGVITLEGWPGAGKTELLHAYERGIDPDRVCLRSILRPDFDRTVLLGILGEMLVGPFAPSPSFPDVKGLLAGRADAGQATVLLVDDAHALTDGALQALGTIADLAADERALLSIVLVVQPPFVELFSRPAAAALDRRASVRVRLPLLTPAEARLLIEHRLREAGAANPVDVLSPEAIEAIVVEAGGIPRRLLSLGDRVLQAGYAQRCRPVDYATAEAALRGKAPLGPVPPNRVRPPISVEPRGFGDFGGSRPARKAADASARMVIPAMLLIVAAGLGYYLWTQSDDTSEPPPPPTQAATPPAETQAPPPAVAAAPTPNTTAPSPAPAAAPAPPPPASPPQPAAVPVDVLFMTARRGDTLRTLYRDAYRTPRYRPPFDQMLTTNPGLAADQPLAAGQLIALPGPLIDR